MIWKVSHAIKAQESELLYTFFHCKHRLREMAEIKNIQARTVYAMHRYKLKHELEITDQNTCYV